VGLSFFSSRSDLARAVHVDTGRLAMGAEAAKPTQAHILERLSAEFDKPNATRRGTKHAKS
jgi:hypothetical protein